MRYSCFDQQYMSTLSHVLLKQAVTARAINSNIFGIDGVHIITKTSKLLANMRHAMDKIV
ncbi:hypothetical protein [Leucothrix arctica]|uniref:hypothetical protein n=1 Tax=Leucothrix arctica TaxID=1481894 RepID=UPI0011B1E38B|nr:hypothetical protein [Leucothrix arctica]